MISWTLQIALCWVLFGIFFGFERVTRAAFLDVRMSEKEFSFKVGPAAIIYLLGLIAFAVS